MTLRTPGSVTTSRRGARGLQGIPGAPGSGGSGGGADLTLVPLLEELPPWSDSYYGPELSVAQTFILGTAVFPSRVRAFSVLPIDQAVAQSANSANYWRMELTKLDAIDAAPTVIATLTTSSAGGVALAQSVAYFLDGVLFDPSGALLEPGDTLAVVWTPVGLPVSSPAQMNHTARIEPV